MSGGGPGNQVVSLDFVEPPPVYKEDKHSDSTGILLSALDSGRGFGSGIAG
jgi:hypothetical protein